MRFILFLILVTASPQYSRAQKVTYEEIFGDDWKKAMTFESENRSWMQPMLSRNHISYPLAIAIVFPEMMRYSALRDKIEITLLKALYINLGEDYANFSIGHFQMKPSFAEYIRDQVPTVLNRRSGIHFKRSSEYDNIKVYRRSVVTDLEDIRTEFKYLIAFMKICERNYNIGRMDDISKLKFLSTAYNSGINKSADEIQSMSDKKFFNTKLFKTENYSYSDVSLYWYKRYLEEYHLNIK